MVGAATITTSEVELPEDLPNFSFADPFIVLTAVIAAVLAFVVAYRFYRFYRVSGLIYLLGIVIGFSFITFAEILLATLLVADISLESNIAIFNLLFWLRLISLSYGFSFLAFSYYYKNRTEDRTQLIMRTAALSVIPLMFLIAIVVLTPSISALPAYHKTDEYFRVFNLFMLGYVFKSTLGSIIEQGRKEFMYIPAAYAALWLGQYSALIFNLDGNISTFIAEHIAKIIGLALFVGVLSQVMRAKRVAKTGTET